jgi:hypothetical protein
MAATSEIDAFDAAVTAQNKRLALAFIDGFPSSQLVPTLIELLRPEVAQEVCATLPSGATRAEEACQSLATAQDQYPSGTGVVDSGTSAAALSPQAGPVTRSKVFVSETTRSDGNVDPPALMPPLSEAGDEAESDETKANRPATTKDTPKPHRDGPIAVSGVGGDPGSGDTGGANSVATHGKDPGGGDSTSDGGSNNDSHQ